MKLEQKKGGGDGLHNWCFDCMSSKTLTCPTCGEAKDISHYSKSVTHANGYKPHCRVCESKAVRGDVELKKHKPGGAPVARSVPPTKVEGVDIVGNITMTSLVEKAAALIAKDAETGNTDYAYQMRNWLDSHDHYGRLPSLPKSLWVQFNKFLDSVKATGKVLVPFEKGMRTTKQDMEGAKVFSLITTPTDDLLKELKRRGYTGKLQLTKTIEL